MLAIRLAFRPLAVGLLLLALGAVVRPAWTQTRYLVDAPGTWKAWKPFSAISSARTDRGATPVEVKAFEATLLELNAVLRRAPGVATPRGYSVETWGYLAGFGRPAPGQPAGKSLPLAGGLDFGAFPIFESERDGKVVRKDTGETALMLFVVNDPWTGSSRKPEEWGGVVTDAFMQPTPKGEVAGIPLYGDALIITTSPERLWAPVPLGAALDLVVARRRVDVAACQESLEKFIAQLAVVRDPAWQAKRMKEAREGAAQMPKPEEFIASIQASLRIEEASLVQEISPTGGTGKSLVEAQRAVDEVTAWLAELPPAARAAPACYAAEAKGLRAKFRPGLSAGCVAIVRPNYQYFNLALPRSAPQVLSITPVAQCFDTANKYNSDANSKSPAGCAANRALIQTMDQAAIRAWLR